MNWDDLEVAFTSSRDEWACYLDLRTGEVHIVPDAGFADGGGALHEEELETGLAEGYLVPIEALPPSVEWGWMAEFATSVEDTCLRERLQVALDGRGAFGRFKNVLAQRPDERARWFTFRDERLRAAMLKWLAEHDIEPSTPRKPLPPCVR